MTVNPISIENLAYSYPSKGKQQSPILKIDSWSVNENERVFLYGDSGSGKTTLMNLLCGLFTASQGQVNIHGQDLGSLSGVQRDAFRAKNIGVVFQKFNLIPYLTVYKNILLANYFASQHVDDLEKRAQALARNLKLPVDILNRKVSELSVGQQQRVAIVRAMINKPRILLVDEPTSALDASARDAFMNELTRLSDEARTAMIFVSHDKALGQYFDTRVDLNILNKADTFDQEGSEHISDAKTERNGPKRDGEVII